MTNKIFQDYNVAVTVEAITFYLRNSSEEVEVLKPGAEMPIIGKGIISPLTGEENLRRPTMLRVIDQETVFIKEVGREDSTGQTLREKEINDAHISLTLHPGIKAVGRVVYRPEDIEQQETS